MFTLPIRFLSFVFKINTQSIEIQKRVGAFAMALDTINKCLSEAISALSRGRLDGESRTAGLLYSGSEILETYKYHPEVRSYQSLLFHYDFYLFSLHFFCPRGIYD